MSKKVVIIGAGGHAKVVADIIEKSGDRVYGFLDDNIETGTYLENKENWKVIGDLNSRFSLPITHKDLEFIIAIGNNETRKKIVENNNEIKYYTAIHPKANIGTNVTIGEGTVIMANACINPFAKIGKHCIINTGAVVEHDNLIEDYVHISPNATLCGTVKIGQNTHIGAGATIINNISITNDCIIGAASLVTKDIKENGTYIGAPVKKIK